MKTLKIITLSVFAAMISFALLPNAAVAAELTLSTGLYDQGAANFLGTLEADNLVENNVLVQFANFINMSTYAQNLDKNQGWDFRWLIVNTVGTDEDGVTDSYIYPKARGRGTGADDNLPFYWNDQTAWSDEEVHVEGVESNYAEPFAYPLDLESNEILLKEVFLVLYNEDIENTMLLLQNGKYYFYLMQTGPSVTYSGVSVVTDITNYGNTEAVALKLEDLLSSSGFGTWDVIPTCPDCGFSFLYVQ